MMRLTPFCRGSHCPLNGLQPFVFVYLVVFGAMPKFGYKFENRPFHHIGTC